MTMARRTASAARILGCAEIRRCRHGTQSLQAEENVIVGHIWDGFSAWMFAPNRAWPSVVQSSWYSLSLSESQHRGHRDRPSEAWQVEIEQRE